MLIRTRFLRPTAPNLRRVVSFEGAKLVILVSIKNQIYGILNVNWEREKGVGTIGKTLYNQ